MPIEYGGEEQAIVAVGLARPRPGVFVEAIQHLLVLCTTTEVGWLGSRSWSMWCSAGLLRQQKRELDRSAVAMRRGVQRHRPLAPTRPADCAAGRVLLPGPQRQRRPVRRAHAAAAAAVQVGGFG